MLTTDHLTIHISVKVVEAVQVERPQRSSSKGAGKQAECLVGDSTASIIFIARDEQGVYIHFIKSNWYLILENIRAELHAWMAPS